MRPIDADAMKEYIANYTGIEKADKIREWIDKQPTVSGWISVKDRLPEDGQHVLVVCEIHPIGRASRKYVCEAFYARKFSISDVSSEDDIAYDYNEEDDEYYLEEGWYECVHNWDEYSSIIIEDFVTHWMPMPEPPKEDDHATD